MTTYVTETGSKYEVDHERGFWKKNGGPTQRIWWAYGVEADAADKCGSWSDVQELPKLPITPGVRMYIGSREEWWLTTEIVEVIEDGEA